VTEGALVQNGQTTALATVQQLDPIYVDVTQSSNDFLRLKQELANGTLKQENGKAKVELVTNDGMKYPQSGTLEFSDVTVDQTTGSITLRAIFPNPDTRCCQVCSFARVWKKGPIQCTAGSTAGCDPYAAWRC
jgi:membrane fusion protein (multidrug efflux system)